MRSGAPRFAMRTSSWIEDAVNISRILATSLAVFATDGLAQTPWPRQAGKIIVPYSPRGTVDFSPRQIAQKLSEQLGHPFIVEKKVGASGTIDVATPAKTAPR